MNAIEIEGLTKKFNGFTAVDNISFFVEEGELFGLLGPNGAGKTTTINMLSTILAPTSGKAVVAGFNVLKNRNDVRRSIGIVFQEPALDGKLSGKENLEFHAMMYGMKKDEFKKRINEVLELVELTDKAGLLVEKYSGGMKRRLEIARGLIHRPKVLFLDEPTLGLDTQTRRHVWDYIKKLNKEGNVTIILTTHYMDEADYLCDRIAIIDKGKIVALDKPKQLKDLLGGDIVSLEVNQDCKAFILELNKLKWIKALKQHNCFIDLTLEKGEKRIPELIAFAQKLSVKIDSVSLRKPSLEDVFLHFTGKTIREEEAGIKERNKQFVHGRMRA
ncbi:ATP-binding cassette domain-containing protein [Candidatus Micrarchaeota archaeon]|nr:ATP-binding cassette domain-containing protein [Candidatus Micrarchaeota archaeon]